MSTTTTTTPTTADSPSLLRTTRQSREVAQGFDTGTNWQQIIALNFYKEKQQESLNRQKREIQRRQREVQAEENEQEKEGEEVGENDSDSSVEVTMLRTSQAPLSSSTMTNTSLKSTLPAPLSISHADINTNTNTLDNTQAATTSTNFSTVANKLKSTPIQAPPLSHTVSCQSSNTASNTNHMVQVGSKRHSPQQSHSATKSTCNSNSFSSSSCNHPNTNKRYRTSTESITYTENPSHAYDQPLTVLKPVKNPLGVLRRIIFSLTDFNQVCDVVLAVTGLAKERISELMERDQAQVDAMPPLEPV